MKNKLLLAAVVLASVFFVACRENPENSDDPKDPDPETPTLTISAPEQIEFNADGTGDYSEITVATNQPDWDYTMDPGDGHGWLTADKSGDKLTLIAAPRTEETAPATVAITFSAGEATTVTVTASQLAATPHVERPYLYKIFGPGIALTAISENGHYTAGYNGDAGIVVDVTKLIHVTNEETGEEETAFEEGYEVEVYTLEDNPDMMIDFVFALQAVDNDGNAYPMSVTPDGSTTLYYRKIDGKQTPFIIENGVEKALPFPDEYYVVPEDMRGVLPDCISSDGNVIVGRFLTYHPYVSMYWKKNAAGEYVCGSIAPELVVTTQNGEYIDMVEYPVNQPASGVSFNGRYAYGSIHTGTDSADPRKPYIFDIETGVTTLVPDQISANATLATDDGTLFFATPFAGGAVRTPWVFENGVTRTFAEWVKENYDLDVENTGTVRAISRDRKVVVWFENTVEYGYVNHIIVVK